MFAWFFFLLLVNVIFFLFFIIINFLHGYSLQAFSELSNTFPQYIHIKCFIFNKLSSLVFELKCVAYNNQTNLWLFIIMALNKYLLYSFLLLLSEDGVAMLETELKEAAEGKDLETELLFSREFTVIILFSPPF